MAYIRKVKTKSGATAVQVVEKRSGQIVSLKHIGSAHSETQLQALMALAGQQLHQNQPSLFPEASKALAIKLRHSVSRLLFRVLEGQYQALGFNRLNDPDFTRLCIARMVEPTSKLDSLRVLLDLGVAGLTKDRLYRCLKRINSGNYREQIHQVCFAAVSGRALNLVLYDVTTLYFEIQEEDNYRKPGLSKERRLEPQIVIGLLVDQTGFPLSVHSFTGNTAETKTILPVLELFRQEHDLPKITVVADAAMMNRTNLAALAAAGYSYVIGSRLAKVPYGLGQYRKNTNGRWLKEGRIMVEKHEDYRIIYQYREKRAALDLRNLELQVAKARRIVLGQAPAYRSKFVSVKTKSKSLNLKLIAKARVLAGIKGYVTNLKTSDDQVIAAYHQLFQVEKSFRMAKSDLKARPVFHRKREAIEAHLTVVLAALAVGRKLEARSGLSLKQLVKTLRPIRCGVIVLNGQEYLVQEEIPEDIHRLLRKLGLRGLGH